MNLALVSPQLELHTAQMKDLVSRGNYVTAYICNGSLKSCTVNPFNRTSICRFCNFRAKLAASYVGVKSKRMNFKNFNNEIDSDIKEQIEIGVMSTMASTTFMQNKSQLNSKWLQAHDEMFDSGLDIYNYFCDEIDAEKLDFLFVFNGRFACSKPSVLAAKTKKIGFGVYDLKKSLHEITFVNESLHSIKGNTRKAISAYITDKTEAAIQAEKFFGLKIESQDTGDPIYTKSQEKGNLPAEIVISDRKIITVFTNSDFEFKWIGKEWDGIIIEDQVEEIEQLASSLESEKYLIIVRLHPNQASTPEDTVSRYSILKKRHDHVVIIAPMSKVDTYALLKRSDTIVAFISTIAVEACYSRKPVVLIGTADYAKMNIGHTVSSGREAGALIRNGVKVKPVKGAVIWGNYIISCKDILASYERVSKGDYRIDGKIFGMSTWRRLLQIPAKLEIEMSKPGFKFNLSFLKKIRTKVRYFVFGKAAV
jgi:hypothetical protein